MSKVYFITGANRGIGFALTNHLAADPNNTIIAAARDPTKATELNKLAEKGNVRVVKLDVGSQESIDGLADQLTEVAADGIDYFISNAATGPKTAGPAMTVPREDWMDVLAANTVGPVMISQVLYPFLSKKDTKVMFFISSDLGSIGTLTPFPCSSYGMSKAALNHYTKLLSIELADEGFITVAGHPGSVSTESAKKAVEKLTDPEVLAVIKATTITPQECASRLTSLITKLTKEDSGKFLSNTGEEIPW